jgi:CheY-like chemotaxis protein
VRISGAVLVVDDNLGALRLAERYLTRLGHRVHTADSVAAALKRLGNDTYDLVVTDLRMP